MSLVYTADNRSRLYVGGKSDAKNRDKLVQWGVKYILNVTTAKEKGMQQSGVPNFFEKDRSFTYKRIPVYDTSTSASDLLGYADSIVDFISRGLYHGAVLVHCNMGQSRSTTAALFFLMRKANMSLSKALEIIQRRRPAAEPIPAFKEILQTYEGRCIKEREKEAKAEGDKCAVEKKRGAKAEDGGKDKRRKVGPSIGPARGPATGPIIGPARVPPLVIIPSKGKAKAIGPARPPSGPSIGPSMPPNATKTKETIGPALPPTDSTESSSTPPKKKTIGPSVPLRLEE